MDTGLAGPFSGKRSKQRQKQLLSPLNVNHGMQGRSHARGSTITRTYRASSTIKSKAETEAIELEMKGRQQTPRKADDADSELKGIPSQSLTSDTREN